MCGFISQKVKSETVKLREGDKGTGKGYSRPKMINLKGAVDEFYYLKILFHQMIPLGG